ncbi:HAMP domain-containing protein [Rhizobium daejeonense]|uniref:HAMP domain-containing protein n=1 Tax=Rhizobium daejeonense TaxID=240521 RepID=A0A6M1RVS3_9HYPH|nr:HAMP domain-containing methyl-accepting chemotaxis protein [Rhizobium daejeonense]NGO62923.1 HAMP domain-containing protein [Rhizobium daejeonense]
MSFIDRLLQSRRIVTKVLLFVVPLVILMAGVGLLGYHTATMLNGHMTVTRATIGNISDLEKVQAALQEFTIDPSEDSRSALVAAISAEENGLSVLDGVLAEQAAKAELGDLRALADKMRIQLDAMWANKTERDNLDASIEASLAAIETEGGQIKKQVEFVRKEFTEKEQFAKELLFDSSAFKGLVDKLGKMRAGVQMAFTPTEQLDEARLYMGAIAKELARAESISSPKSKATIAEVAGAVTKLDSILAGNESDDAKAQALGRQLSELVSIEQKLTLQAAKNTDVASDRFVGLDKLVADQKELMELVDTAAIGIDALRLHSERMRGVVDDASRQQVLSDLKALSGAAKQISALGSKNSALRDFAKKIEPHVAAIESQSASLLALDETWRKERATASEYVSKAMSSLRDFVSHAQEIGKEDSERSASISVIAMVVGTLLAIVGGLMLIETLRAPLKRITEVMTRLAGGDLAVPIEGRNRGDEIGDMVRSVTVFRDAAVENRRLEDEAASARTMSAKEAEQRAREREQVEAEQRSALDALSEVLEALAAGNLEATMRDNLPGDFVAMAETYNHAVEALRATLADVRSTSVDIDAGTGNLAVSADDLARRTEQQAAALEESARALAHLSDVVRSTADGAGRTAQSVHLARDHARQSGVVVTHAVEAMAEISRSSEKISTIIGVIDEIAFQTNLLALNAGVEAARAGEAGRGFAVVAQEVRELAQRCASAAKEIKGLISVSSGQVKSGVALVEQTGEALQAIIDQVEEVQTLVESISSATREQSTGISEVTKAVKDVELITQRNAAMVEENNAEIQGLRHRVEVLMAKIDQFKTRDLASQHKLGANERRHEDVAMRRSA